MGSFSIWHWLIVLLIVVLVFGTKKLRNIGSDVGGAVKNFKDAMASEQNGTMTNSETSPLIEAKAVEVPAAKRVAAPRKKATTTKPAVKKAATPKAAKPKAAVKAKSE